MAARVPGARSAGTCTCTAQIVLEVDQHADTGTLTNAEEGQPEPALPPRTSSSTPGSVLSGRCQTSGCAPRLEWRRELRQSLLPRRRRDPGAGLDAEHRRPRDPGAVGGVGQQVAETGQPERAVGPGVLAQRQLEVGRGAVRRRGGGSAGPGRASCAGAGVGDRGRRRCRWRPGRRCPPRWPGARCRRHQSARDGWRRACGHRVDGVGRHRDGGSTVRQARRAAGRCRRRDRRAGQGWPSCRHAVSLRPVVSSRRGRHGM